jgi:hypothetical protein
MGYIETWKEVMQRPSDFFREMPKTGGYADPLTFAAISFIIYALLAAFLTILLAAGCIWTACTAECTMACTVL